MQKFFTAIPNRLKAVYLLWTFIHFVLFLFGSSFNYSEYFYPIGSVATDKFYNLRRIYDKGIAFDINVYDYSEFLLYVVTPVIIYFVLRLWNKKDE